MLLPTAGPAAGPFPPGPAASPSQGAAPNPVELLDAMLKLATLYRSVETDPQKKLAMERVSTLVQQLEAQEAAALQGGAR